VSCEVDHERIPPKTPNKNAHIELFHAILEKERLSKDEYARYQEAHEAVTEFITFYNQRRIHGRDGPYLRAVALYVRQHGKGPSSS